MKHAILLAILMLMLPVFSAAQITNLRPVQRIPLPGVAGKIGRLSCDVAGKRLFVAEYGNGAVETLMLTSGKRASMVGDLPMPQGILYEPASRRLFVTTAGDGACRVFDAATSPTKPLATVPLGTNPDQIRFMPDLNQVAVGYGSALGFVSVPSMTKITGAMALGGHPESFLVEGGGRRYYVNVPDAQCVTVLGAQKATWPLGARVGNFPMALDEAHHRLFIGCRTPAALLVLDTASGQPVARVKIGSDCDDIFYDARTGKIYAISGAGFISVFAQQMTPERYQPAGIVSTALGARTGLLVPELDRLFIAAPRSPGHEAEIIGYALK